MKLKQKKVLLAQQHQNKTAKLKQRTALPIQQQIQTFQMKTALTEFVLPGYNRKMQLKQKTAFPVQQHQHKTMKWKQRTTLPVQHQKLTFQMETALPNLTCNQKHPSSLSTSHQQSPSP